MQSATYLIQRSANCVTATSIISLLCHQIAYIVHRRDRSLICALVSSPEQATTTTGSSRRTDLSSAKKSQSLAVRDIDPADIVLNGDIIEEIGLEGFVEAVPNLPNCNYFALWIHQVITDPDYAATVGIEAYPEAAEEPRAEDGELLHALLLEVGMGCDQNHAEVANSGAAHSECSERDGAEDEPSPE